MISAARAANTKLAEQPLKNSAEGQANAGAELPRRLFVYSTGFFINRRVNQILRQAGWSPRIGLPGQGDSVGVWGDSPTAHRGHRIAGKRNARLVYVEDAFLRSLRPGRQGDAPMGLIVDTKGLHFDARQPSDLEGILLDDPLDQSDLLTRARNAIDWIKHAKLSKYSATRTDLPLPEPGYVLVIDQTRDDASIRASNGNRARFLEMLAFAREENPGARIVIRAHPETALGLRSGHFERGDCGPNDILHDDPVPPWDLLDGATAVYTLSSQMGFEAILAGHKPRVFGTPFYAGWGLTQDEDLIPRRTRRLTAAQLFAGAMIRYPIWFDPYRGRISEIEDVIAGLEAQARAWREDRAGWSAQGMRLWKRPAIRQFYGAGGGVRFDKPGTKPGDNRPVMAWANSVPAQTAIIRVEDGFLRSRGLGAQLVPPLSLVLDEDGIYYDPAKPSRLEALIAQSHRLKNIQIKRSEALIQSIIANKLTKYNLSSAMPTLPAGERILVVGQVEDDASITLGCSDIRTNADLLARARAENPDATLIWKPHPDVEAGLRAGAVPNPGEWADIVLDSVSIAEVLPQIHHVWTMTSLTGFESLLRGMPVTVLGAPFYAGWGLTRDLGAVPARRLAGPRPTLSGLAHAALIDYPRYFDPVTRMACPPEVAMERLTTGDGQSGVPTLRALSKLQGIAASMGGQGLWRR